MRGSGWINSRRMEAHSLSYDLREVIVSIFHIDYDSAGAGEGVLAVIFGLHLDGVFLCFLVG